MPSKFPPNLTPIIITLSWLTEQGLLDVGGPVTPAQIEQALLGREESPLTACLHLGLAKPITKTWYGSTADMVSWRMAVADSIMQASTVRKAVRALVTPASSEPTADDKRLTLAAILGTLSFAPALSSMRDTLVSCAQRVLDGGVVDEELKRARATLADSDDALRAITTLLERSQVRDEVQDDADVDDEPSSSLAAATTAVNASKTDSSANESDDEAERHKMEQKLAASVAQFMSCEYRDLDPAHKAFLLQWMCDKILEFPQIEQLQDQLSIEMEVALEKLHKAQRRYAKHAAQAARDSVPAIMQLIRQDARRKFLGKKQDAYLRRCALEGPIKAAGSLGGYAPGAKIVRAVYDIPGSVVVKAVDAAKRLLVCEHADGFVEELSLIDVRGGKARADVSDVALVAQLFREDVDALEADGSLAVLRDFVAGVPDCDAALQRLACAPHGETDRVLTPFGPALVCARRSAAEGGAVVARLEWGATAYLRAEECTPRPFTSWMAGRRTAEDSQKTRAIARRQARVDEIERGMRVRPLAVSADGARVFPIEGCAEALVVHANEQQCERIDASALAARFGVELSAEAANRTHPPPPRIEWLVPPALRAAEHLGFDCMQPSALAHAVFARLYDDLSLYLPPAPAWLGDAFQPRSPSEFAHVLLAMDAALLQALARGHAVPPWPPGFKPPHVAPVPEAPRLPVDDDLAAARDGHGAGAVAARWLEGKLTRLYRAHDAAVEARRAVEASGGSGGDLAPDAAAARQSDCALLFLLRWLPKRKQWRARVREARSAYDVVAEAIKLETATNELRRSRLYREALAVGSTVHYSGKAHRAVLAKRRGKPAWWSRVPAEQDSLDGAFKTRVMRFEQFATHCVLLLDSMERDDDAMAAMAAHDDNRVEGDDEDAASQQQAQQQHQQQQQQQQPSGELDKWKHFRTGHRCKVRECRLYAIRGNAGHCEAHRQVAPQLAPRRKLVADDDYCFVCFEGGELLCCEEPTCPRVFHAACLARVPAPDDNDWRCPLHGAAHPLVQAQAVHMLMRAAQIDGAILVAGRPGENDWAPSTLVGLRYKAISQAAYATLEEFGRDADEMRASFRRAAKAAQNEALQDAAERVHKSIKGKLKSLRAEQAAPSEGGGAKRVRVFEEDKEDDGALAVGSPVPVGVALDNLQLACALGSNVRTCWPYPGEKLPEFFRRPRGRRKLGEATWSEPVADADQAHLVVYLLPEDDAEFVSGDVARVHRLARIDDLLAKVRRADEALARERVSYDACLAEARAVCALVAERRAAAWTARPWPELDAKVHAMLHDQGNDGVVVTIADRARMQATPEIAAADPWRANALVRVVLDGVPMAPPHGGALVARVRVRAEPPPAPRVGDAVLAEVSTGGSAWPATLLAVDSERGASVAFDHDSSVAVGVVPLRMRDGAAAAPLEYWAIGRQVEVARNGVVERGTLLGLEPAIRVKLGREVAEVSARQVRLAWALPENDVDAPLVFNAAAKRARPQEATMPAVCVRLVTRYELLGECDVLAVRAAAEPPASDAKKSLKRGDKVDVFLGDRWVGPCLFAGADSDAEVRVNVRHCEMAVDARWVRAWQEPKRVYLDHDAEQWREGDCVLVDYEGEAFRGVISECSNQKLMSIFYPDDGSTEHKVDAARILRRC